MTPESRSNRNLILLWAAQFVSRAGDFLFTAILVFLVLSIEEVDAKAKSGTIWLFMTLPFLLFGVFAGALVDRFDRRKVMLLSDLFRAACVALVPIAFFMGQGQLNWIVVGVSVFLVSTFSTVFNPARDSLIPDLAGKRRPLLRINSFFQSSEQIAMIGAMMFAGLFLGITGEKGDPDKVPQMINLVILNGLSFLASFGLILLIRYKPEAAERKRSTLSWNDVFSGLRYAFRDGTLRRLLIVTAASNFFIMGPAVVGINFFVKDRLGLGAESVPFAHMSFAVGWFAGTVFLIRYGARFRKGNLFVLGMLMDGATFLPYILFDRYPPLLVMIGIHGFFVAFVTVGRTTFIQEYVPREMLGKVFALINLTVAGFMGLSCVATGLAGEVLDPGHLYLLAGIGGTLCGVAAVFSRHLRAM